MLIHLSSAVPLFKKVQELITIFDLFLKFSENKFYHALPLGKFCP